MVNKIAFLFPGQGSQMIGMAKIYADASPTAKSLISKADEILGFSLSKIMFEGPEDQLKETEVTQPALFTASAAALEILNEKGIKPHWAAGHSLGEYSALYAAGVFSFEEGLRLVRSRGEAMSSAGKQNPGTMAAIIGLSADKISTICQNVSKPSSVCVPANINSDSQIVISGHIDAVKTSMEQCQAAGAAKVIQLNVAGAFHSPLMSEAAQTMRSHLNKVSLQDARFPVFTNVDAKETRSASEFKEKLVQQIDHPVLWDNTLRELCKTDVDCYIEVGSGRVLSMMAKKLDRKKTVLCTDDLESINKTFSSAPTI